MIGAIALMMAILGGGNFYIGRRLFQWLKLLFPQINGIAFASVLVFLVFSMVIGQLPLPSPYKGIMSWIGSHWMGIFIYLLLFFLLVDVLVLLGSLARIIPAPVPQIVRFCAGLTALVLAAGFVSYGLYNANQVKTVTYEIQTKEATLPVNMKIVLISDLHFGEINSEKLLESVVQNVNSLDPDIVCITGDIMNHNYNAIRNPNKVIELLKSIESAYGVFACLGNHDSGATLNQLIGMLEQSNVRLLNDEHIAIDGRLILAGRVDASPIGGFAGLKRKDFAAVLAGIGDTNMPVVVMDHNPSHIDEYGGEVDLVLSGHTHKGQIFPGNLFTGAMFTVDYGHYQKNAESPHVIVSSGAGTWAMPMRIGTSNEVVGISLR
jgi:predicted MPP superfamily phosphohydrolase